MKASLSSSRRLEPDTIPHDIWDAGSSVVFVFSFGADTESLAHVFLVNTVESAFSLHSVESFDHDGFVAVESLHGAFRGPHAEGGREFRQKCSFSARPAKSLRGGFRMCVVGSLPQGIFQLLFSSRRAILGWAPAREKRPSSEMLRAAAGSFSSRERRRPISFWEMGSSPPRLVSASC